MAAVQYPDGSHKVNRFKKIITYGLRYSDFDKQRELFALRNNGDIEIIAEIAYEAGDKEIFFKRMPIPEGLACEYDLVIVCSGTIEEAREKLLESGFDDIRVEYMSVLTKPHYEKIKQKQLTILRELADASDEEIKDRDWLKNKLCEYGFFPFFKLVKKPQDEVVWSTLGILQVPDEFIDFCLFLMDHKIDSAIEIGVARGSSSYIMAAILSRNNPDLIYHMVDIMDCLVDFETVKKIIPALHKDIPSTSDDFTGKEFDFCFIDANHSYDGMMLDWNNVGRYAKKLTVLHDIFGHEYDNLNGGTVRGWKEIKESVGERDRVREFSVFQDKWMGIGVVDRDGVNNR